MLGWKGMMRSTKAQGYERACNKSNSGGIDGVIHPPYKAINSKAGIQNELWQRSGWQCYPNCLCQALLGGDFKHALTTAPCKAYHSAHNACYHLFIQLLAVPVDRLTSHLNDEMNLKGCLDFVLLPPS